MPVDSVRENLIQAVVTRLEAIGTDPDFWYRGKLRGVERYIHDFNFEDNVADNDQQINSADDLTILVIPETESDDFPGAPDNAIAVSLTLTISFRLGPTARCAEYNAALADLKRALFRDWDHLGVGAELESGVNERLIPDSGLPHDTVVYRLTLTYIEVLGDPTNT